MQFNVFLTAVIAIEGDDTTHVRSRYISHFGRRSFPLPSAISKTTPHGLGIFFKHLISELIRR